MSGPKRSGKTLFMVHEILRTAGRPVVCPVCTFAGPVGRFGRQKRVRHRMRVATNIWPLALPEKLAPHVVHVASWADCMANDAHCTLFVIDEIQTWSPADALYSLPEDERRWLAQMGHDAGEMLWSAQSEDRVSIGVRRLTDQIALVAVGWFGARLVRFGLFEHADKLRSSAAAAYAGGRRPASAIRPLWVYRFRVSRRVSRCYNTHQWGRVGREVPPAA